MTVPEKLRRLFGRRKPTLRELQLGDLYTTDVNGVRWTRPAFPLDSEWTRVGEAPVDSPPMRTTGEKAE